MSLIDFLFGRGKKHFRLGSIRATLKMTDSGVLFTTPLLSLTFIDQQPEALRNLLETNFRIVAGYFRSLAGDAIIGEEIDEMAIHIMAENLYVNNLVRATNPVYNNLDLTFRKKDFTHPTTQYDVINYFRAKYPLDYIPKVLPLLQMNEVQLQNFEELKASFETKPKPDVTSETRPGIIQQKVTRIV